MRKPVLLFALFALLAPLVFAQVPRTVTLEHATEREDGTALTAAEIERAEVECYAVGSSEAVTAFAIVPPNTSRATDPVFTAGDFICRAWTVDTLGQRSAEAAESNVFTVAHPCQESPSTENCASPNPPRSITVTL